MTNKRFITRAEQQAKVEAADVSDAPTAVAEDIKQAWLDPERQPVTAENIEQILADAQPPKRAEILKQPVEAWQENATAHRLRQCVNFLHAHGLIPDGDAIRLKEEIEQQERT